MLSLQEVRSRVKALGSHDENTRWDAVRALKAHESQAWDALPNDAFPPLIEALRSQLQKKNNANGKGLPHLFRQDVVAVLANLGTRAKPALPELSALLEDGEAQGLRESAVTALGKIGAPAKSALDALLHMLTPGCRGNLAARVVKTVAEIGCGDQRVGAALAALWTTPGQSETCREQTALALCKLELDAPGLDYTLSKALVTSTHAPTRKVSAEALSWRKKTAPGVVPALVAALYDADEEVRALAEAGLKRMKLTREQAIEICAAGLEDSPHAEVSLRRAGALSVPALIVAVESKKAIVRDKAAQVLGSLGEAALGAAKALTKAVRDSQPEVRLSAAKALWNATKQADVAVPALAGLLKAKKGADEEAEDWRRFVQSIIEALGRIGPAAKAAMPELKAKLKDSNRLIKESAERALRLIEAPVLTKTA